MRAGAEGSTSVRTAVNHALRPRSQSTVPRSQRADHGVRYGCAESYADRRVVGLVGIGRDACSSATSSLADGRRDGSLCKSDSTIDTSSCEYLQACALQQVQALLRRHRNSGGAGRTLGVG